VNTPLNTPGTKNNMKFANLTSILFLLVLFFALPLLSTGQTCSVTSQSGSNVCVGSNVIFSAGASINSYSINTDQSNYTQVSWSGSSLKIQWSKPGSYEVDFALTGCAAKITLFITVTNSGSGGTLTNANQSICDGEAPKSLTWQNQNGKLVGWAKREIGSTNWAAIKDSNGDLYQQETLESALMENSPGWEYQLEVLNCEGSKYIVAQVTKGDSCYPPIVLDNPTVGEVLKRGVNYQVSWNGGNPDGDFVVDLYAGSTKVSNLGTVSTESLTWLVDEGLPDGTNYKIKVTQNSLTGDSPYFSISEVHYNIITDRVFDENSDVVGGSKAFFDLRGRQLQSQRWDPSSHQAFAHEILKDEQDRPSLQTLEAPLKGTYSDPTAMEYFPGFVKSSGTNGGDYNFTNWEKTNPDEIGNQEGTLGWYYSAANFLETNVAHSSYPFSITEYYDDGSCETKSTSGVGEAYIKNPDHKVYSKDFPVLNDLDDTYLKVRNALLGENTGTYAKGLIKTVVRDQNGHEVVQYMDPNKNVVASGFGDIVDDTQTKSNIIEFPIVYDNYNWESSQNSQKPYLDFYIPIGQEVNVPMTGQGLSYQGLTKGSASAPSNGSLITSLNPTLSGDFYRCFNCANISYSHSLYDMSFNFYDLKGRLIASVAPLGVKDILANKASLGGSYDVNNIPFTTYFTYDFQGRLRSMKEPDAKRNGGDGQVQVDKQGITEYIYRKDGSIRFSQNPKQRSLGVFSYTNYDPLGRPVESGEYHGPESFESMKGNDLILEDKTSEGGIISKPAYRQDWIKTFYDLKDDHPGETTEINGNVIVLDKYNSSQPLAVAREEVVLEAGFEVHGDEFEGKIAEPGSDPVVPVPDIKLYKDQKFVRGAVSYTENENSKTWYSYDELGRLAWMQTWYPHYFKNEPKLLTYQYDYFGNVVAIAYQPNNANSNNSDSFYHFYKYDKNQRLSEVYASTKVIDQQNPDQSTLKAKYEYYLHGPLKRMILANNAQYVDFKYTLQGWLKAVNDPNETPSNNDPEDIFGFSLGHLYNGMISSNKWTSRYNGMSNTSQFNYNYDHKYQLLSASPVSGSAFEVSDLAYDANGNIQSILRKDLNGGNLHDFASTDDKKFVYYDETNQLKSAPGYASYAYNEIGQLEEMTKDNSGEKVKYRYKVDGKVTGILNGDNTLQHEYLYDDRGFRIRKEAPGYTNKPLVYVRDASGSILAVYQDNKDGTFSPIEFPVYGASRLGTYYKSNDRTVYELKDHLGNIRATFYPTGEGGTGSSTSTKTYSYEFFYSDNQSFGGASSNDWSDYNSNYVSSPYSLYVERGQSFSQTYPVKSGDQVNFSVYYGNSYYTSDRSNMILEFVDQGGQVTELENVSKYYNLYTGQQPPDFGYYVSSKYTMSGDGFVRLTLGCTSTTDEAYFDNLTVNITNTVETSDVVSEVLSSSDYYPFGLRMSYADRPSETYRYGYQGEFAEEDDETGFNHFEARDYDPVIGRWMVTDPARQHFSPYLSMGNNPISSVDPNGGEDIIHMRNGEEVSRIKTDDNYDIVIHEFDFTNNAFDMVTVGVYDKWVYSGSQGFSKPLASGATEPFYFGSDLTDIVEGLANFYEGNLGDGAFSLAAAAVPFVSWKSVKRFRHTFTEHGEGIKNTARLIDRARGTGKHQGQWLNNQKAAELLQEYHGDAPFSIREIPEGLGQVIKPDGTIVPATRAIVIPYKGGGIRTAYPIE